MTLVEFIRAWPDTWPHPEECITKSYHDKDFELDWYFDKDNKVSVSITMDGNVVWAALVKAQSFKGKSISPKEIPIELIDIFNGLGF